MDTIVIAVGNNGYYYHTYGQACIPLSYLWVTIDTIAISTGNHGYHCYTYGIHGYYCHTYG